MELKFKALFEHIVTGNKIWLKSTVNYTVPKLSGYMQKTDWQQYVGKKDIDGNEIFISDVFKFKFVNLEGLGYEEVELVGSFSFGEDLSFEIDVLGDDKYVVLHYTSITGRFKDFKIVGNLFEEPFKA